MVNDDNDKWSDNGELPINSIVEPPKRNVLKNQSNGQKVLSTEGKTNSVKTQSNDQKEGKTNSTNTKNDTKNNTIIKNTNGLPNTDSFPNSNHSSQQDNKNLKTNTSLQEPVKEQIKDLIHENQDQKDQLFKLKEETKEPKYLKDFGKYVKNLASTVSQLHEDLTKFTNAKSWEAISRGTVDVLKFANYYDRHDTIKTATASDPNDFDSASYNVERIYETIERYAEIIYITNDGTDTLYAIVSHGGKTRFSTEAPIYPGEIKFIYNIYEIRLRSPTAGLPYRVTEYRITSLQDISSKPIEKYNLHNSILPAANTNLLTTDITPTNYPTTLMIEVATSIAGNFSAVVTRGGNSQIVTFNVVSGPPLVPGGLYIFNLLVHNGDSVNFIYSATGGLVQILRVQELDSASA